MAPSPHRITVEPNPKRVVVTFAGETIADSRHALTLREGSLPPALYIPREDVEMDLLTRTAHGSHCPFKGDAAYYTIDAGGRTAENAVWTYEEPLPGVAGIAGHLAFYPSRVDSIEER